MSRVIDAPSGAAAGGIYLVDYDEDQWKKYDAESQEFCKSEWIKKASVIDQVRWVVLKLHPDELFPMHGNEQPYVEWRHTVDRPPESGFTVSASITVTIPDDAKYCDPVMRAEITIQLGKSRYPAGATYRIVNTRGDLIEHGRL